MFEIGKKFLFIEAKRSLQTTQRNMEMHMKEAISISQFE